MNQPEVGYTFDDYLLVPQFSDVKSRSNVDISTVFCGYSMATPVIPANMDTITGEQMMVTLPDLGQVAMPHRYMNSDLLLDKRVARMCVPSIGIQASDMLTSMNLFVLGYRAICIDVAHGHNKYVGEMILYLKKIGFEYVVAGNVATYEGAKYLADCGATYVKVGVGPGSVCQTRGMTGHGVPQMTAIMEAARGIRTSGNTRAGLIADGGISAPGDIAKALAAGADFVMSGYIFAGCEETPHPGAYRGMASLESQVANRGKVSNDTPEGVSLQVATKGSVFDVFREVAGGLRSALSYSGCHNLEEFKNRSVLRLVSSHTVVENGTRG